MTDSAQALQEANLKFNDDLDDYEDLIPSGEAEPVDIEDDEVITTKAQYKELLQGKDWLPLVYRHWTPESKYAGTNKKMKPPQ